MNLKAVTVSILMVLNLSALTVGENPKNITISGENGGLVKENGGEWNSSSLKDKVMVMFYVDPDEKDANEHFSKALKEQNYNREKFGSIAVVNLAATWKPNFVIESILEEKQLEFPHTIYVKDRNSVIVNEWAVEDDASNIIIFSKTGKVLFYKSGAMSDEDSTKAMQIIESNL